MASRTPAQTARDSERYHSDPEFREKVKERNRRYYERNREKVKAKVAADRKARAREHWGYQVVRYGLTLESWYALLVAQSGRCAICNAPMTSPHVDHDHVTGRVRGLLCSPCNTGIGHMQDDPERLRSAADYLERVG